MRCVIFPRTKGEAPLPEMVKAGMMENDAASPWAILALDHAAFLARSPNP
jgi:hypothetical protein